MEKAFISHRSTHKDYARKLVEAIGRDYCFIDEFDFHAGEPTMEAIVKRINLSPIFVILISRDALSSQWVSAELSKAKELADRGVIKTFLPFLIEEGMTPADAPEWMVKEWSVTLRVITSPLIAAQYVKRARRELMIKDHAALAPVMSAFIGRSAELESVKNDMLMAGIGGSSMKRALIVSGRPGTGRERFIGRVIQELDPLSPQPILFPIRMKRNSRLDYFLLQLHEGFGLSRAHFEDLMAEGEERMMAKAVEYVNRIINVQASLFIDDERSIVRYDGEIEPWAIGIINHPAMIEKSNRLSVFIASLARPRHSILSGNDSIIHVSLPPFTTEERLQLLAIRCRARGCAESVSADDLRYFADKLRLNVKQLDDAADMIAKRGTRYARREINHLIEAGDSGVRGIIADFGEDHLAMQLLLLLAEVDMISFDLLEKIQEGEFYRVNELISQFETQSLVSFFGPADSYISLDYAVADSLRRSRFDMDADLRSRLEEVVEETLDSLGDDLGDISAYLYDLKLSLMRGRDDSRAAYMMPSVVLGTVADLYDRGDYKDVIRICLRALDNSDTYLQESKREIVYRLCQAYARTKNDAFNKWIGRIEDQGDKAFLKGFYYRYKECYEAAERELLRALRLVPRMKVARRELVNVYLNQGKYPQAMDMARENYEGDPSNPFHIEAHFRCLVNVWPWKEGHDQKLRDLIGQLSRSESRKRDVILDAMQLEYDVKSRKLAQADLDRRIVELRAQYGSGMPPSLSRIVAEYEGDKARFTR